MIGHHLFGGRRAHPGAGGWGPNSVEVAARRLRLGAGHAATLTVTGYPREVGAGWLEPLLTHPARLDVAVHVDPLPAPLAADRLRRQRARLESARRLSADKGRLSDPELDVAAADATDLAGRLARGQSRLFRVALTVTVHAPTERSLDAELGRLRAVCASLLLDTHPATFRAVQGWVSTLPLGLELLGNRRTMDTDALAAGFPFTTADLPLPADGAGVLYGRAVRGGGLVVWDRFAQPNHNQVILARSGAGKSYLTKLETLRQLYAGVQVAVIDPEDEYRPLADLVGGTYLPLGAPGMHLNPCELDPAGDGPDALMRRAVFLHTLISLLAGGPLDPPARAALDRAILTAYAAVGISADPRTHTRPAPQLTGLVAALTAGDDPAGRALAGRLTPYTTGSHAGLFTGATSSRPDGHLVVWSLRQLPDELKGVGTLLAVDAIWRQVTNPATRRRRLVVVDEAWQLMRDPAGAVFLFRLAKAARKHWTGLTVVTQDAADLLGSDLGQAVVANAATQILLRQAPQAIDPVAAAFGLSAGERAFLLAARVGDAILAAGPDRVAFHATASDHEHAAITAAADLGQ